MALEDVLTKGFENTKLLSASSNKVFKVMHGGESYILKTKNLTAFSSPFWRGMQTIFASNYKTQHEHIEKVLKALANPYLSVAQLIMKNDKDYSQLFEEIDGASYAPDEFPLNDNIEHQLGLFLGYVHSKAFNYFGQIDAPVHGLFKEKMLAAMAENINDYWIDDYEVGKMFQEISDYDISPATFCLIMPDISANQFVYDHTLGLIRAVVDFDAYVIGPREWELAVVEMCLKDGQAFKKGYEASFSAAELSAEERRFYRFYMYLCDLGEKKDLSLYLDGNAVLADSNV